MISALTTVLSILATTTERPEDPFRLKGEGECHAFTTYCQFRGVAAVAIAVVVFMGLPAFVLATNVGFRKAGAISAAALFAYLTLHGFLWLFYPRGPIVSRKVAGLPLSISSRMPALLLMIGSGAVMILLCIALNRIDRTPREEAMLRE